MAPFWGGRQMAVFFKILLVLVSILLIGVVLLQSGKSAGLSGSIAGGAEQIMGKAKARGIDALLNKLTIILATAFMILSIVVAYFLR
jgi:preprotein translocase subunit SecG